MLPSKKSPHFELKTSLFRKHKTKTRGDDSYPLTNIKNQKTISTGYPNRHSLPGQNIPIRLEPFRKKQRLYQVSNNFECMPKSSQQKMQARISDFTDKENELIISKNLHHRNIKNHAISERSPQKFVGRIFKNPRVVLNERKMQEVGKQQRKKQDSYKISIKQKTSTLTKRNKTEKDNASYQQDKIRDSKMKGCEEKSIRFEFCSVIGSKNTNQDYIKCGQNIWILCDGHGEYGHQVSEFVAQILFELLRHSRNKKILSKKRIGEIFAQTQEILESSHIDISLSGSTCTLLIKDQGIFYSANVGDSPALLLTDHQNQFKEIFLEHKPALIEERKRIQFYGGSVRRHPMKTAIKESPLRLWGTNEDEWGPGLAVSRAFGDKMAQKYGLICEPSICEIKCGEHNSYIIIGSDGVFDKIGYQEIQYLIQRERKQVGVLQTQLCTSIVQVARKRWSAYSDDVSAILIYL